MNTKARICAAGLFLASCESSQKSERIDRNEDLAAVLVDSAKTKEAQDTTVNTESTLDSKPSIHKRKKLQQQVENAVYLTIDDGPWPYTKEILQALNSLGIKATFFRLGENITTSHQESLQHLLQSGHVIGNHSYSHKNFAKISLDQAKFEVEETEKKY